MSNPESHLREAQKLTADAEIDLWRIQLTNGVVFLFKNGNTVTWQGEQYEGLAVSIKGDKQSADDEESRVTLRVMNPAGIFTLPARDGLLDRAIVTRKRILGQHLENDVDIYTQRMWYVERLKELVSGQFIGLEIRPMSDGPSFKIPYRMFIPPEFKSVSL